VLGVSVRRGAGPIPGELCLDAADHPVLRHLPRSSGRRSVVSPVELDPSVVVLGRVATTAALWTVTRGGGRVLHHGVVTDDALLDDPLHRTVVGRALRWVVEGP
jgi:hypothetical protein